MLIIVAHADPATVLARYPALLPSGAAVRPFVLPGGSSAAYEQHARSLRAAARASFMAAKPFV